MAGLEKLKSIFANVRKFESKTNLTTFNSHHDNITLSDQTPIKGIYLKNPSKLSETISFNSTNISAAEKFSPILQNNKIKKPSTP